MNAAADKRGEERIDRETDLSIRKPGETDRFQDARMYNYSRRGLYFRSAEKLKIGQEIYIRILDLDEDADDYEDSDFYTGYVRWSEDLGTSQPGGQYGYGIQYAEPVF